MILNEMMLKGNRAHLQPKIFFMNFLCAHIAKSYLSGGEKLKKQD